MTIGGRFAVMPKTAYEVHEPVEVDVADPQTGRRLIVKFTAGSHSPKNEGEEAALNAAVASGAASAPGTKPKPEPTQEAEK